MENNLKLTALPFETVVKKLRQAGSRSISNESLSADIANGAPVNSDGTINLITYAAWLAKKTDDGN